MGCGSTCGVVTGGVSGIGSLMASRTGTTSKSLETRIHEMSYSYVTWFESRFGTCLCRERVQVDFATLPGILRYFIPGIKLLKCLHHIGIAVEFLDRMIRQETVGEAVTAGPEPARASQPEEPHCACGVLRDLETVDASSLQHLVHAATGLMGGTACSGGACGALLGSFLAMGLEFGYDPRSMGLFKITRAFIRGHGNLLKHETFAERTPAHVPVEAFARSRYLADGFRKHFGSLDCREITGRRFSSPAEVRSFLRESTVCNEIQTWCKQETFKLLNYAA